ARWRAEPGPIVPPRGGMSPIFCWRKSQTGSELRQYRIVVAHDFHVVVFRTPGFSWNAPERRVLAAAVEDRVCFDRPRACCNREGGPVCHPLFPIEQIADVGMVELGPVICTAKKALEGCESELLIFFRGVLAVRARI